MEGCSKKFNVLLPRMAKIADRSRENEMVHCIPMLYIDLLTSLALIIMLYMVLTCPCGGASTNKYNYIEVTFTSLTVVGTVRSTFSSCLKPVVIASTTTINELFTIARCCIVEITGNSCPARSSLWLKSTSICCKQYFNYLAATSFVLQLTTYTGILTALSGVKSVYTSCASLTSTIDELFASCRC